jgi:hypothetical protein
MLEGGGLGRGGLGQTDCRQRQRKQPVHSHPLLFFLLCSALFSSQQTTTLRLRC